MRVLTVKSEQHGDVVRVAIAGEFDLAGVRTVEEELRRVEQDRPPVVLLDLRELTFLDSSGLRCILTADERAREEGRRLAIAQGAEPVRRIFEITAVDRRLDLVDDVSELIEPA